MDAWGPLSLRLQPALQTRKSAMAKPLFTTSLSYMTRSRLYQNMRHKEKFLTPQLSKVRRTGWPDWLVAVAGEALKGWLPRRANSFEKIDKIGQGTYSNVYKARDLESGQVVALKKVRFEKMEPESVRFMAREIIILRKLDHPNVVKLEGLVTSRMSCSLYLVFEFLDHDLAGISATPNISFTEPQVKCYLLQILKGLDHCHKQGVLHRDIKGSNLLLDREGNLKIADFGLATFFQPDKKQQLTTRVVTLWYRPPELLLGATEYDTGIDLWSVGCILGELFAGRPILPGRTEVEQLHKIFKLCGSPPEEYWNKYKLSHATIFKPQHPYKRILTETYKHFPQSALDLLDVLLALDPQDRGSASSALQSDFFNTKPFACEPACLPKYVPSKSDGKGRDVKGRRQRSVAAKTGEDSSQKEGSQEISSKLAAAQESLNPKNGAILTSNNARSKSERFIIQPKEIAFKLPPNLPRQQQREGGRNEVHALPPDGAQPEIAVPNLTWAGLLDRKPRDEGPNAVRTRPPLSRSIRHTTTMPDFSNITALGSYATQHQGSGLSKLSTLVATRNNRSQELQQDGFELKSSERFSDRRAMKAGPMRPAHLVRGIDGLNAQEHAGHERDNKTGLSGLTSRIHISGPLLTKSADVERIMHEHDSHMQKAFRRARHGRDKKGELQAFGDKGANESMRDGGYKDRYETSMANDGHSKYRPRMLGETSKMKKDAEVMPEMYDYHHELQYL
ncbi:hypothetical protein GOP47_0019994 [Adiantum capillus-veneris]|uniref:Protein kinase domain-containing protein n=1 Tax=Adiantum capillus-veneris TaxID=13818 RepID=A0A9D4UC41_ADICA|nr:hypothetical protein GOP47_0019994 [Adiantum capillus-veneris]